MSRSVCVHGHFYQPPRDNPWLGSVERQVSAAPFHDWNARVCAESYRPNKAARILNSRGSIVDIVNNYSRMSFNFGPTLLSWLEEEAGDVYRAILEADRESQARFSGHGAALAQAYSHMILPLATERDKTTQVIWGLADFAHRFGRSPEGLWLPETAVDTATLEVLAAQNVKFTLLAPHQAGAVRKIDGNDGWRDIGPRDLDPRKPYLCSLPSGRRMVLFFYDGPLAHDIAFGGLLRSGAELTRRFRANFAESEDGPQLVHVATDGETYGHHHRFGEMALAFCLKAIESSRDVSLTIFGEFLEKHRPEYEVKIKENTSWSCVHGIERWRADCGCSAGRSKRGRQDWRSPLRAAMDSLRLTLDVLFEDGMKDYTEDPWSWRDAYISLLLDGSQENRDRFFARQGKGRSLKPDSRATILKLLEVQRNRMLMYTSCGWFFDDIAGLESVQVLTYAARAMQLASDLDGHDREPDFLELLAKAPSHSSGYAHGGEVYNSRVKSAVFDDFRLGAHWALASLLGDSRDSRDLGFTTLKGVSPSRRVSEEDSRAAGRMDVKSGLLEETRTLAFIGILSDEIAPLVGLASVPGGTEEIETEEEFRAAIGKEPASKLRDWIRNICDPHVFSLDDLLEEERSRIVHTAFKSSLDDLESSLMRLSETLPQGIRGEGYEVNKEAALIRSGQEFLLNRRFRRLVGEQEVDGFELKSLIEEFLVWDLEPSSRTLAAGTDVWSRDILARLQRDPENSSLWRELEVVLSTLKRIPGTVDLWAAQSRFFEFCRSLRRSSGSDRSSRLALSQANLEAAGQVQKLLGMRCL